MDDQNQNPQNIVQPNSSQNNEEPAPKIDGQQAPQSSYPPLFSVNSSDQNTGNNSYSSNNGQSSVKKTVGKFFLGGTQNVDRIDRFTPAAIISFVAYLVTLGLLVGMSYLHYKFGDSWLKTPFIIVTVLGLLSIVYFGWVKRELLFGRGLVWNVVRHGTAVAISFLYIAGIVLISSVGWNYSHIAKSTSTTNNQSQQTTK